MFTQNWLHAWEVSTLKDQSRFLYCFKKILKIIYNRKVSFLNYLCYLDFVWCILCTTWVSKVRFISVGDFFRHPKNLYCFIISIFIIILSWVGFIVLSVHYTANSRSISLYISVFSLFLMFGYSLSECQTCGDKWWPSPLCIVSRSAMVWAVPSQPSSPPS